MNESTKSLMAGLLIIASVGAAVGIIIAASGVRGELGPSQQYTVYFDPGSDIQGLDDKSTVRLFGAEVGGVDDIDIVEGPDEGHRVRVAFSIPKRYTLRHGAVVTVQSQITGGARLNITSLGDGQPLAPEESLVGETLTLGDIMAQINGMIPTTKSGIESIKKTSDNIGSLVEDVHGKVDHLVEQYDQVMDTAEHALANARDILGDSTTDLRTTIVNIKDLTDVTKERLPKLLDHLDPALAEAKELMIKANDSMAKLDTIFDDTKAVTGQVREIIDTNQANIDQTLVNVRRTSVELKGGVAEIRRAPWRLLNKPDEKDQRNLELFEAARQFADGAHDLQAAAMTIQLAAANPNTDAAQLEAMRAELATQIDGFIELRQRLYERFER